ncbi:MAG: conjugal transfer protein TraF [Planctomycetota bacterium]|jgi:hypothetical protein|nr:conjugal transfer protein TraF [Planctomycetota bacterium]
MLKSTLVILSLLLFSEPLAAQQAGTRNDAMGGTGVASSDYLGAAFVNPALVTRYSHVDDDDWGLMLPNFGIFVGDPDKVLDDLEDIEQSFDAIDNAWSGGSAPTQAQLDTLAANLSALSSKALQLQAFGGAVLAIPSKNVGVSLVIRGNIDAAAMMMVDGADVTAIEDALSSGSLPTLDSEAIMLAAGVSEVGLAIGTTFDIDGKDLAVGITPKMQRVEVFNYAVSIEDAGNIDNDYDNETYRNDDTALNFDLGAHMKFGDNLSAGLAVRDVLEQEILTPTTGGRAYTYTLSPVVTAGVAWQEGFLTVATDIDITKRDGFSNTDGMQFARIGAEAGWTWGQLRAGYRTDLEETADDMFTAGIGLSPFGVFHLDLAGAIGEDSYGALLALSVTF